MIARYTRPAMARLWSEERKLALWFDVQLAVVEAMASRGLVPEEAARHIREHACFSPERVREIEQETRHDVASFVQCLEESVGPEYGRWIHFGLTSSDVLDTAFALQLVEAADAMLEGLDALLGALARRAREFAATPMMGRSHGIHAEATTFGHVLAGHHAELARGRRRLVAAREDVRVGKVSGPVGTFSNVLPEVEAHVCAALGLAVDPASTQVVARDRHAQYFATLGVVASSLERLAVGIRHLQRTEVGEVEERFHVGQKGSSAMPHKRNPVLSENITGLARLVRGYVAPAMENVALWHERDISHSSVERVIAPDATATLDFALRRMARVVDELVVYPQRMRQNLAMTRGLHFSQTVLLRLVEAGLARQQAYTLVQGAAMRAWSEGLDFAVVAGESTELVAVLGAERLAQCFDLEHALRHVPAVIERALGAPEA